uniref:Putative secreted protein n=1 Tax=Anopheles triannulatus TaxID=58253 RepID=A0A2M4B101_9DIPT
MWLETLVRLFCCCCSVGCVSTTFRLAPCDCCVSEGAEREGKKWLGLELLGAAVAAAAAIENGMIGVG